MFKHYNKLVLMLMIAIILPLTSATTSPAQAALLLEGVLSVDGAKVADGEKVELTLRIFDDEYAGKLLYEETQKITIKSDKVSFRFAQGKVTVPKKQPLPPASQLWVEIESENQVMVPRLNLAEVDKSSDLIDSSGTQSLERTGLRTAGDQGLIIGDSDAEMMLESDKEVTFNCKNTYTGLGGTAIYAEGSSIAIKAVSESTGVYAVGESVNGVGIYGQGGIGVRGHGRFCGVSGSGEEPDSKGGTFSSSGDCGIGVYGQAFTNDHDKVNYGGYFTADGISTDTCHSSGISAYATNEGDFLTYGGQFTSSSKRGIGAFGHAEGDNGRGLYGTADGTTGIGVVGWGSAGGATDTNYGGFFKSEGGNGYGVYAEATGSSSNTYGVYGKAKTGIGVYGKATDDLFGIGVKGVGGKYGVEGSGVNYDFYASGSGSDSNFGPFTGAHDVRFAENMPEEIEPGMIVVSTGRVESCWKDNGQISFSSTLPTVTLATKTNDKTVFGVIVAQSALPEEHWYHPGDGERFGIVNALGEGRVWVSNINGSIEAGDYITSSTLAGYGQLQDDDILHTYTVGKATETVDWKDVSEFIITDGGRKIKIYPIAVVYTSG